MQREKIKICVSGCDTSAHCPVVTAVTATTRKESRGEGRGREGGGESRRRKERRGEV